MKLNLGCGIYKKVGWINIDQYESVNPDVVCDIRKLPYEDGVADDVYLGHVLEHFTYDEGQRVLKEILRVLKPKGKAYVVVPDMKAICRAYLEGKVDIRTLNDWFIYSYVQDSHHQYCYDEQLLHQALKEAGFSMVLKMPGDHPYLTAPAWFQVGAIGVKS